MEFERAGGVGAAPLKRYHPSVPELPEVETVRRGLARILKGRPVIAALETSGKKLRRPIPPGLKRKLAGQALLGVRRRGKYLLLDTGTLTLISHLGMTGTWRLAAAGDGDRHDHLSIVLADGRRLVFRDPRRFGLLLACPAGREEKNVWLKDLGREPLDAAAFNGAYLRGVARRRRTSIKALVMDQKVVVGIGNIYASEALYRAGVAPGARCPRLTAARLERLCGAVRKVLGEAIAAGGTTISDFRQAGGSPGYFGRQLRVYDREGKPCRKCGEAIRRLRHAGRSTYWCRRCQAA